MADYVTMTNGKKSSRKYQRITVEGYLTDGDSRPAVGAVPGEVVLFVDDRSSIVTTDPLSFEKWIAN